MATLFEPSLSTSTMRQSLSATTTSAADSLPNINFGFDELRDRMARFTNRFDNFIAEGRKRVLEERNHFRLNVAELHGMSASALPSGFHSGLTCTLIAEDQKTKKRDLEILSQKATTHNHVLAKEAAETEEMHSAIDAITIQHTARSHHRDTLLGQKAAVQKQIAARLDVQRQHAAQFDFQAAFNGPELDFWVEYLGLRIEGAGMADRLKFVFTQIDDRDWEREAWFELCTERREYEVLHWAPKVEKERVDEVVERLNEGRDLGIFLKRMRELFVEATR